MISVVLFKQPASGPAQCLPHLPCDSSLYPPCFRPLAHGIKGPGLILHTVHSKILPMAETLEQDFLWVKKKYLVHICQYAKPLSIQGYCLSLLLKDAFLSGKKHH